MVEKKNALLSLPLLVLGPTKQPTFRDRIVGIKNPGIRESSRCRTILLSLLRDRNGFMVSPSERNEVHWIYDGDVRGQLR